MNVRAVVSVLTIAGAMCCGCQGPRWDRQRYPIGVWYDVRPNAADSPDAIVARFNNDSAVLRSLDLDLLLIESDDARQRASIAEASAHTAIRAIIPDEPSSEYITTGKSANGYPTPWWISFHTRRSVQPVVWLGAVTGPESAARARELAQVHHQRPEAPLTLIVRDVASPAQVDDVGASLVTCVPRGATEEYDRGLDTCPGNVAVIHVQQPAADSDASVDRWLADYHRALADGRTAGLLFDSFRSARPQWIALVDAKSAVSTKRAAAVKRIVTRAGKWGPRLAGARAQSLSAQLDPSAGVDVVLFIRDKRRFVMMFNSSPTEFVRNPISLAAVFDGLEATRLVTVPVDDQAVVGDVHRVHQGKVTLETDLAPGDARLFEVF